MAVAVVEVKHDGTKGHVTMQSDKENGSQAIQELQHGSTKNAAIEAAAKQGLPDPRVEMQSAPYAVDETGATVNPGDREAKIAAYRVDIPVVRRLV